MVYSSKCENQEFKKWFFLLFINRFISRVLLYIHSLRCPAGWCVLVYTTWLWDCGSALLEQTCPVLCSAPIMNDVVVMDIHQHGDRLANDERDPHSSVAIVSIQETAHKPCQRNLKGWRFRGPSRFESYWWQSDRKGELCLTWAIIPIKAHSLNIFRGTLTRYWKI